MMMTHAQFNFAMQSNEFDGILHVSPNRTETNADDSIYEPQNDTIAAITLLHGTYVDEML